MVNGRDDDELAAIVLVAERLARSLYTNLTELSGVPRSTLARVKKGETARPRLNTCLGIQHGLQELQERARRSRSGFREKRVHEARELIARFEVAAESLYPRWQALPTTGSEEGEQGKLQQTPASGSLDPERVQLLRDMRSLSARLEHFQATMTPVIRTTSSNVDHIRTTVDRLTSFLDRLLERLGPSPTHKA